LLIPTLEMYFSVLHDNFTERIYPCKNMWAQGYKRILDKLEKDPYTTCSPHNHYLHYLMKHPTIRVKIYFIIPILPLSFSLFCYLFPPFLNLSLSRNHLKLQQYQLIEGFGFGFGHVFKFWREREDLGLERKQRFWLRVWILKMRVYILKKIEIVWFGGGWVLFERWILKREMREERKRGEGDEKGERK